MKRIISARAFLCAALLCVMAVGGSQRAFAADAKPDWVDGWRAIYPDGEYIAQLGKAQGKKASAESKTNAANTVAQYLQTTVQSEVNTSTSFTSQSRANGTLATSTRKENSQNVTLSVDLTLSSLEFTEPWYNKKEKAWYCVAYVSRQKAWEQYRPTLQAARDKLFAFYTAAEKTEEPLYRMRYYAQSLEYEEPFFEAYSFARLFSVPLTEEHYGADSAFVSGVRAKSAEEKSRCTFSLAVSGDVQDIVYQKLKDALSGEGYTVRNAGEEAVYTVSVAVQLADNPTGGLHVIRPAVELSVDGKTAAVFSYAKQTANASGLNEGIARSKAARSLADEIERSFMQEFGDALGRSADDDLSRLLGL